MTCRVCALNAVGHILYIQKILNCANVVNTTKIVSNSSLIVLFKNPANNRLSEQEEKKN